MKNCINCQKRLIARMVLTIIDVKPSELARYLHVSESLVSKYLAGCKETGQNRKEEPALKSLALGVLGYNLGFQKSPKSPFCSSIIPKKLKYLRQDI